MRIKVFRSRSYVRLGLISAFLVCASLACPANAITVTYSTEANYTSAVGIELFFEDFDGSSGTLIGGDTFNPNIAFLSPEAADPSLVMWNNDVITDAGSTTALNDVGPIEGVFTSPVQAFSLHFLGSNLAPTISLFDDSNNLIASMNAQGFFGVTSTTPVARFEIAQGELNGLRMRYFINDFRANEIPEPATISLLVIGGLHLLRSKKSVLT